MSDVELNLDGEEGGVTWIGRRGVTWIGRRKVSLG